MDQTSHHTEPKPEAAIPRLTAARLALVQAALTVLRIVLTIIGVSAPEKM